MKELWRLRQEFVRFCFWVLGGYKWSGGENVPTTGGVLICPNHVCYADPPAVAGALPRNPYFMATATLFTNPTYKYLVRLWRSFPINANSPDRAALRHAENLLRAGEVVVVFPEGQCNTENTLQPLHEGALLLALRTRMPLMPVALFHTADVWRFGTDHPRRSGIPVRVVIGAPLDLSDLYGKHGAVKEATRRLTVTLAAMLGQPVPVGKPRQEKTEPVHEPTQERATGDIIPLAAG